MWREATHISRRAFHPRSETLESNQCNPVKRSMLGNHLSLSSSGILGWHSRDWTLYGRCEWRHRFFDSLKNHYTLSSKRCKIHLRVTFTNDAGTPWPVWLNAISHGRDQHQGTPHPSGSRALKSLRGGPFHSALPSGRDNHVTVIQTGTSWRVKGETVKLPKKGGQGTWMRLTKEFTCIAHGHRQ